MTVQQLTQLLTHVLIGFFSLIISLDLETFENLNGLVMEESVYSGDDTNF